MLDEARRLAAEEGVALNQLIHVAVAEKLAAIRTEAFFRERGRGADIPKALAILERLGVENSPEPGDELPDDERQTAQLRIDLVARILYPCF